MFKWVTLTRRRMRWCKIYFMLKLRRAMAQGGAGQRDDFICWGGRCQRLIFKTRVVIYLCNFCSVSTVFFFCSNCTMQFSDLRFVFGTVLVCCVFLWVFLLLIIRLSFKRQAFICSHSLQKRRNEMFLLQLLVRVCCFVSVSALFQPFLADKSWVSVVSAALHRYSRQFLSRYLYVHV